MTVGRRRPYPRVGCGVVRAGRWQDFDLRRSVDERSRLTLCLLADDVLYRVARVRRDWTVAARRAKHLELSCPRIQQLVDEKAIAPLSNGRFDHHDGRVRSLRRLGIPSSAQDEHKQISWQVAKVFELRNRRANSVPSCSRIGICRRPGEYSFIEVTNHHNLATRLHFSSFPGHHG